MMTSATSNIRGSLRWMAPELFQSDSTNKVVTRHSEITDMWAFGMVAYELLSGELPYSNMTRDAQVILAVAKGELPGKPMQVGDQEIFDKTWNLCCSCWALDGKSRPTAKQAVESWSIYAHSREDENVDHITNEQCFCVPLRHFPWAHRLLGRKQDN